MTTITTTTTATTDASTPTPETHSVAFALVRDAASLMDTVDPGMTSLAGHDYAPVTVRVRRIYSPRQDSLTLIAYHGREVVATVIAARMGQRLIARIHQIRVAGMLFTRHSAWGFVTTATIAGRARRLTLTGSFAGQWRLEITGEAPADFADLDAAAAHLTGYVTNPSP
jgi:hypothetical protein